MKIYLPNQKWGHISLLRQTENYSGAIGRLVYSPFYDKEYDYALLVGLGESELYAQAKKLRNTIWFYMENPRVWRPSAELLNEIDLVVSPFEIQEGVTSKMRHLKYYPCVPWFYGICFSTTSGLLHKPRTSQLELGKIKKAIFPRKNRLLSMIVSGKEGTPGHSWRAYIAKGLKDYFGSLIDLYGFGHNPVADKADALAPYLHSVVIENESDPYYITEKIADCLIGWTIPIYSGSTRIDQLLEANIPTIPFGCSSEEVIRRVCNALRTGGISDGDLSVARNSAINKTNIFESLDSLLRAL